MKKWIGIPLAFLFVAGLYPSAWANSELHPGGRLFFPLWDVSTVNRLTFIIVTREALRDDQKIVRITETRNETTVNRYVVEGGGKCLPRGVNGSTSNVNRADLGGSSSNPVFVDDVHFEYYGRTCIQADEIVHMSCGDTDLFLLGNNEGIAPRRAFALVAGDGRGALDVHFVRNVALDPRQRKLENSLMGHAVIVDLAHGWVAGYDPAAAKALPCPLCDLIDGGTEVGYENYPREVYLPFALADGSPLSGGTLQNRLALWGPSLLPGGNLGGTSINVIIKWWDGRERAFSVSRASHSINEPLSTLDLRFHVSNFVCGHATNPNRAENDGFPRIARQGGGALGCDGPEAPDPAHKSDNFESVGDTNIEGHSIQPSTPMGWWRFRLLSDGQPPPGVLEALGPENVDHSGRGLVGVVLSASQPDCRGFRCQPNEKGVGDAVRLWHEDPCEVAQSGQTFGPPHARDKVFGILGEEADNLVPFFNVFKFAGQEFLCAL